MTPRKPKPAAAKPVEPAEVTSTENDRGLTRVFGLGSLPPPGAFESFRRKPGTIRATFIHEGDYAIETQEGVVATSGPFWLAIDHLGYPYPVSVATFRAVWEAA